MTPVHNHGTEDGPGLACPERIIDGKRKGKCMESVIPAEAVEAAAKLIYRTSGRKRVMSYEQARPTCEDEAQLILEAAAPYMLAGAWEEGYMFSYDQERGGNGELPIPVPEYLRDDLAHWNPHRTPNAR